MPPAFETPQIDRQVASVGARSPGSEASCADHGCAERESAASGRRLRNWLIAANLAAWLLIVFAIRAVFF
jgi:hypothetical protein